MNLANYEPELIDTFCNLINSGMTIIDVGAHVGIYSLLASTKVGPSGKVVAIEPSPANARLLRQHLNINQCTNTEVIEAAIATNRGKLPSTIVGTDRSGVICKFDGLRYFGRERDCSGHDPG